MTETPSSAHFKVDMPKIPGVNGPSARPPRRNPLLPLIIGFLVLGLVILVAVRWFSHNKSAEPERVEPTPQIDVPSPPPDPLASLPVATESDPTIATETDLAKPWSSVEFLIKNKLSGENIPAIIVRLPGGSPAQPSGYWAFSRKAPYGSCQLEYITDIEKLRSDYGYRAANHPLVGNPCSRTLYDPLKTTSILGNIWIRGAIVQGSDIRPPFGVEIKVQGKNILAIRAE
ncbi:MAG TPA: hypothetical protein VII25_09060 [Candidatus Acidoferrum sp.]